MTIQMHKESKKIYATRDGMSWVWQDGKVWSPCTNVPVLGMVWLSKKAYPLQHEALAVKFAPDAGCLAVRLQTGHTQEDFATLLGMTQQAVSRLEAGTRKATKIHKQMIKMVEILNDEGILWKL